MCLLIRLLTISLFLLCSFRASALEPIFPVEDKINLIPSSEYKRLPPGSTLQEGLVKGEWSHYKGQYISLGYTDDVVFLRFALRNDSDDELSRIVAINFSLLDKIDVYFDQEHKYTIGDSIPFTDRPINAFVHAFPVTVPPNTSQVIHLRMETLGGFQVPLFLYSYDRFLQDESIFTLSFFLLCGIILSFMVITLVCYFVYKENAFLPIFALSFSVLCFLASYYSVFFRYIWPHSPELQYEALVYSLALIVMILYLTAINIFRHYATAKYMLFMGIAAFSFPISIVAIYKLISYNLAIKASFALIFVVFTVCLLFCVRVYKQSTTAGMLYFLAFGILLIGGILNTITELGYSDYYYLNHSTLACFTLFLVIFFFIIILKMKKSEDARMKSANALSNIKMTEINRDKAVALGTLVGGLNHELNTPLSTVNSTLRIVKSVSRNDQDLDEVIDRAMIATDKISSILDDLLVMSQTGTKSEYKEIQITRIIDNVVRTFSTPLNGIEIKYQPSKCKIKGVEEMVTQLFINLATNSIHAIHAKMPYETPGINIQIYPEKDEVVVIWSDNGIGMNPEVLSKLFNPFFTTKPVGEGTGLGMSNVQSIVNIHNGTIEADSTEGKFTRFTIKFPLMRQPIK